MALFGRDRVGGRIRGVNSSSGSVASSGASGISSGASFFNRVVGGIISLVATDAEESKTDNCESAGQSFDKGIRKFHKFDIGLCLDWTLLISQGLPKDQALESPRARINCRATASYAIVPALNVAVLYAALPAKTDQRMSRNLFQKVWDAHAVRALANGQTQLLIGTHLIHEVTSPQAFGMLRDLGLKVKFPQRTFATVDHIVPTDQRSEPFADPLADAMIKELREERG